MDGTNREQQAERDEHLLFIVTQTLRILERDYYAADKKTIIGSATECLSQYPKLYKEWRIERDS